MNLYVLYITSGNSVKEQGQHKHTSFMSLQSAGHAPRILLQTGFSSLPHVSAADENDDIVLTMFLTTMVMIMIVL